MKRKLFLGLSILLITGCASFKETSTELTILRTAGTSEATEERHDYGDTIVVGSIGDASNLIPLFASDSASHDIASLVYSGLVRYDKNLNLEGDLAESWEISKDGLAITFHLRKGVKWHDGMEFTADDVIYTYNVATNPKTPTAYSGDFSMVKNAEVLDKYTFRVTYDKPFAPALASWGALILPRHLLEGRDITLSELAWHPIGTGPFRFVEWIKGEKVLLEANPDYWEGRPYIDKYIYRIIPDQASMFLELKFGGIDFMGLTPIQYTQQSEDPEFKRNFNSYRYPSFSYTFVGYNLTNPLFQDKRVRKALSYAIDKQEILDDILLGLGKIATGPYKPGTWVYNDKVERYDYNPGKAKELLAEAGWKDTNGDGVLDKDGKPFEFTVIINEGNEARAKTVELIQKRLKEIGVVVKSRYVEWTTFLQMTAKRDFEAVVLGWTIGQDPDIYDIWHSSKTNGLNFITYKNPEVDELLENARGTFDQNERKRYYDRIQEILADDAPYIYLYVPDALPAFHARFHGIEPAPAGIMHNVIKWNVPKGEQRYLEKFGADTTKSPLMQAASTGQTEMVEALLAKGADMNEKDSNGWTPLMHAAWEGHPDIVRVLLSAGADVNAVEKDGYSVLMTAVSMSFKRQTESPFLDLVKVVEILIEKGADVNYKNKDGWTALAKAAMGYSYARQLFIDTGSKDVAMIPTEFAKLLIERGADVNARDRFGNTALITAAFNGQVETVKLLIEKGTDVNAYDVNGYTVLMNLIGGYNSFLERTSKNKTESAKWLEPIPTEIANILINAGADVNAKNKDGVTALMMAADAGATKIVRLLMGKAADVYAKTNNGVTAFSIAAAKRHTEIAQLLKEGGGGLASGPNRLTARLRFQGFSIFPPQSNSWKVSDSDTKGITFGRNTGKQLHSILASARIKEHKELAIKSGAELLQYAKGEIEGDFKGTRFKPINIKVYSECYQGKDCVRYDFTVEDHGAPYAPGSVLILTGYGFFFLHPDDPKYIVDVNCGQRFPKSDKPLSVEGEVEPFFKSLEFTPVR